MKRDEILGAISNELDRARAKHAPMATIHHGWAVIFEELDELWDEVRAQTPNTERMRAECIQIAAVAIRFIEDLLDRKSAQ